MIKSYRNLVRKPGKQKPLERRDYWTIIFKMDLKYCGKVGAGSVERKVASSCEHGNKLSASTNCGQVPD